MNEVVIVEAGRSPVGKRNGSLAGTHPTDVLGQVITGVLGPHSNAHGPNEFLHVPYAKQLTCCLVRIVAAHYTHNAG